MSNVKEVSELIHSLTNSLNGYVNEIAGQEIGKIIKLHSTIAVVCGLVPIPVLDVLAGFLNIWIMYGKIGAAIGKPMSENLIKSIFLGAIANFGSGLIFLIAIATLVQFIPFFGSFSGAIIMGFTLYAVTVSAGVFYLKALPKIAPYNPPISLISNKVSGEIHTNEHFQIITNGNSKIVKNEHSQNEGIDYYISRKNQRFGPYKYSVLISYIKSGNIKTDDYLWYTGLENWVSVGKFLKRA